MAEDMNNGFENTGKKEKELEVQSINFDIVSKEIQVGETFDIKPTIEYQNKNQDAPDEELKWESGDTSIATVDQTGKVEGKGVGEATITATATDGSNVYAECIVDVKYPQVTSVKFENENQKVKIGEIIELKLSVEPQNIPNYVFQWSSSDESVAIVDNDGKVTGKQKGEAEITATTKDGSEIFATCKVTVVEPILITSVKFDLTEKEIKVNESFVITPTIEPSNATNKTLSWSSSDTSIAIVNQTGKVEGKGVGEATITATATDGSNVYAKCIVDVKYPQVTSVEFENKNKEVKIGEIIELKLKDDSRNISNVFFDWESNNTSIATVDNDGKVTGKQKGEAEITATTKDGSGKSAKCKVTIVESVRITSIKLDSTEKEILVGASFVITPTIEPSNATNQTLSWSSSDTSIATVDQTGKVEGKGVGEATITATATDGSNVFAECIVDVKCPQVTSVKFENENKEVKIGEIIELKLSVEPPNIPNYVFQWSSSDESVATVDNDGKVTGKQKGEAEITATTTDGSEIFATCKVTVVEPILITSIKSDPTKKEILVGESFVITPIIEPSNATNQTLSWKSNDTSIATVDNDGKVIGVKKGKVTITATATDSSTANLTCEITVVDEEKVFEFLISNLNLPKGYSSQLILQSTYEEEKDNKHVVWTSSDSSVVEVSDTGVIKTVKAGQATITCTLYKYGKGKIVKHELASAECAIIVSNNNISDIKFTDRDVDISKGGEKEILELTFCDDSQFNDYNNIIWRCSDESVVEVGYDGTVIAINEGEVVVTACTKDGKVLDTCKVTVTVEDKLYFYPDLIETRVGEWNEVTFGRISEVSDIDFTFSKNLSVKIKGDGGKDKTVSAEDLKQELQNTTKITFQFSVDDEKDASIKAESEKIDATCTIRVMPVVTLSKSTVTIVKGQTYSLEATTSITGGTLEWSIDDKCVSVEDEDEKGKSTRTAKVKGLSAGNATVTAKVTSTVGGSEKVFEASCTVVVEESYREVISGYMDKIIPKYDDSTGKYNLTFSSKYEDDGDVKCETVTLIQGQEKNIPIGDTYVKSLLTEVSFHKEIYQPGCVEVKIKTDAKLDVFKGMVSLGYGNIDTIVANNYYIFEKKKKNGYIVLKAYSVDKFLTIDKGNRAYTAKTLLSCKTTENEFVGIVDDAINKMNATNAGKLYHANVTKKDNTGKEYPGGIIGNLHHVVGPKYFIPYCVQYEETVYDFLVRICNRNGEFLYCEDNMLHVGAKLKVSPEDAITDSMENVEVEYTELDCLYDDTVSNECIYPDEYFDAISNFEDKKFNFGQDSEFTYAKWSDYMPPVSTALGYLKSITQAPNLSQGIAGGMIKAGIQSVATGYFWHSTNEKFRDTYFQGKTEEEKEKIYQFSGTANFLNNSFYKEIFEKEEKAKGGQVVVTFTTCKKYKLGEKVKLDEAFYVVYRVKGSSKVIDTILESNSTKRYKETYELLLLPVVEGKCYPLPMPELRIRRSAPQKAIVVNPMDPKRRGRVQVMYPWQKENSDLTPWLNIAYPKASDGEGFMFIPNQGDVVLVDYEDGNIERPFMVGSFYGDGREPSVPSATHHVGMTKSITSANGHHLSFTDTKGDTKFFAELLPVWSLMSKFGAHLNAHDDVLKENGKFLAGSFELSDYFGIYKISGCTHGRNVTISSPIGDVQIDAFTGITIEAPAGDISIVGKNVKIEAKNNLTMLSGTNIVSPYVPTKKEEIAGAFKDFFGTLFIGSFKKILGLDLSFYRVLFEVLLRPIGGTMLIKSHRFMRLEAGEGKTQLPKKKVLEVNNDSIILKRGTFDEPDFRDSVFREIRGIENNVKSAFQYVTDISKQIKAIESEIKEYLLHPSVERSEKNISLVSKYCQEKLETNEETSVIASRSDEKKLLENSLRTIHSYYAAQCIMVAQYVEEIDNFMHSSTWKQKIKQVLELNLENLDKWVGNNGTGVLIIRNIEINNIIKRKCLFEEIEYYIKHHNDLKDNIIIDSSLIDFNNPNKLHKAIKININIKDNVITNEMNNLLFLANKITGLEGALDDNVWNTRDKGSILISTNKNRMFSMANDGTFKQDIAMMDIIEELRRCIENIQ